MIAAFETSAMAIQTMTVNAQAQWGVTYANINRGTVYVPGDFVIGGCLHKGCSHGTWEDEWAVIGVVANKIATHGGYFCPYQIQCGNSSRSYQTWTHYFHPNMTDGRLWTQKCAWLCEPGYSGTNCMPQNSSPAYCDNTLYNTTAEGKFGGVSLKTYGRDDGECEAEIIGFHAEWVGSGKKERDVILGADKFLDHGIIARPMTIQCGSDNWSSIDSYVLQVSGTWGGYSKLLCAAGYKANADNTDCVPINLQACGIDSMKTCTNFKKELYDSSIHYLVEDNGCVKYFCADPDKAFPSIGDASCEYCAPGIKGGPDWNTGVCVKCQTGQYFDRDANTCKNAKAYAKNDMLYGPGNTKNSTTSQQCWTKLTPDEYAACVRGEKSNKANNKR